MPRTVSFAISVSYPCPKNRWISVYSGGRLWIRECYNCLFYKKNLRLWMSGDIRLGADGVQGVASSNPATPTIDMKKPLSKGSGLLQLGSRFSGFVLFPLEAGALQGCCDHIPFLLKCRRIFVK
jgi:hypothetical protein